MAESAVIGEIPDGVIIVDQDIEIRERAKHCTRKKRLAPMTCWSANARDAGAKNCLAQRIQLSTIMLFSCPETCSTISRMFERMQQDTGTRYLPGDQAVTDGWLQPLTTGILY